jgi:hypothetical protein
MAHRKDIFDFSEQDRSDLANKILDFLGRNEHLLHEHMAIVGSESDPGGERFGAILYTGLTSNDLHENIWHGHRFYISKLEDDLMQNGGERFVPLPKWDAHTKIPGQFKKIYKPHLVAFPPINYDAYNSWSDTSGPTVTIPAVSFTFNGVTVSTPATNVTPRRPQIPEKARDDRIHEIASSMELALTLNDYHFEVHEKLGGVMLDPHHTAASTLFWIWHAALEEFYHKWIRTKLMHARDLRLVQNADGRLEAFAIGDDDTVWHSWQWWRYGGWSYWKSLDRKARQIVVGKNQDGRLEVFAITTDKKSVVHSWQSATTGVIGWSDWPVLREIPSPPGTADPISQIAVANSNDGRLHLFALVRRAGMSVSDLLHIRQVEPNGHWGQWSNLGQGVKLVEIAVGRHRTGVLEVFAIDAAQGIRAIHQKEPDSLDWSDWIRLTPENWKIFDDISVAAGADGQLLLFAIEKTSDRNVFYREVPLRGPVPTPFRPRPGHAGRIEIPAALAGMLSTASRMENWKSLKNGKAMKIAVGAHPDGRLDVFAIGLNRKLTHIVQETSAPHSWLDWDATTGADTSHVLEEIAVARNDRPEPPSLAHGRLEPGTLEVIGKFNAETVWHKWEKSPGSTEWVRWQLF